MSDTERAFAIKQQRNMIMSSLLTVYPGSIDGETIYRSMIGAFPEYSRVVCVKDLYYLESKGYVIRKNPLTGKQDDRAEWLTARWALTAEGNEVGNDVVVDPALEI